MKYLLVTWCISVSLAKFLSLKYKFEQHAVSCGNYMYFWHHQLYSSLFCSWDGCKVLLMSLYVGPSVCLSICLHPKNKMSRFQEISIPTCYLCQWLCPPVTTLQYIMYFSFCGWCHAFIRLPPIPDYLGCPGFAPWCPVSQLDPPRDAKCLGFLYGHGCRF